MAFGRLYPIPNNDYLDATPSISMRILAVYATHKLFTNNVAFNHVVTAGTDGTVVRVSNRRIINTDTSTLDTFWLALGK